MSMYAHFIFCFPSAPPGATLFLRFVHIYIWHPKPQVDETSARLVSCASKMSKVESMSRNLADLVDSVTAKTQLTLEDARLLPRWVNWIR